MRKQILSSEEHTRASSDLSSIESDAQYDVGALEFTPVEEYTTFRAEFTIKDEDKLVFHFFATKEINRLFNPWEYWKESFPAMLEKVAVSFFKSGPPALRAAYADEFASWWLQADGAAEKTLDPHGFARKFLEQLDAELEKFMVTFS